MRFGATLLAASAALVILAAPAFAAPGPASAAFLARTLDEHTTTLSRDRYALAAGPLVAEASARAATARPVRLWAGQDYVFAAACDRACGRLAVRVVAPDGVVLAQTADAAPTLRVRPVVTGRHVIEAAAPNCRSSACWFAVNVYAR